jgi:folate-dependent tRNA-U54 methylase TrmFO/GidA
MRPDDDAIVARFSARKEFRQGVLELRYRLLRSESPLFTVNVNMRQVKVSDSHAGERVEHLVCGVEIRHSLSPCKIGLLQADHERSAATIAVHLKTCKQRMK